MIALKFGSLENLFFASGTEKTQAIDHFALARFFGMLKKYQLIEHFKPHICFYCIYLATTVNSW